MQPQENPAWVLKGLHDDITEGLVLNNLYCLECRPYTILYTYKRIIVPALKQDMTSLI